MSRRVDRSPDARRHRSRFDREPNPKRSRRDVKVESEWPPAETKSNKGRDLDQRQHHRLREPLSLESPLAVSKETDNMINEPQEGTKRSSYQTKVPQSRSYYQHDEHASVSQNARGSTRRTNNERGWWRDSKDGQNRRAEAKTPVSCSKDEKEKDSGAENHMWRHDKYFQMEADKKPPAHKRPAFREQKVPTNPEQTEITAGNPTAPKVHDNVVESGKKDMSRFPSQRFDRYERGERDLDKDKTWSKNSRDRYGGNAGGSRYRGGRERLNVRQRYHQPGGARVEKWKHDLYDEANKGPASKNEEDQISKIESLLAS